MAEEQDETPVAPPQPVLHTENVSSFLDLQSEFIKRRDAAIAGRQTQSFPAEGAHRRTPRNNILAISKEEKRSKIEVATLRTQRIRQNEEAMRKEEQQRAKQQQILQQKAAIYERMAKGERLVYEDGKEAEFLVDFHAKKRELEEEEKSRVSSSSEPTKAAEDASFGTAPPLVIHYDYTEDKGRVFGASHVPLPTLDEEAREQKIKELKAMTEETLRKRAERKRQRNEEEAEERRRLNRVRARMGLEPIPSSEDEGEEEAGDAAELEVSSIPLPSSSSDAKSTAEPEEKQRRLGVREWDRGKIGCMRWVEEQRDEREDEFAPPSFYYNGENAKERKGAKSRDH